MQRRTETVNKALHFRFKIKGFFFYLIIPFIIINPLTSYSIETTEFKNGEIQIESDFLIKKGEIYHLKGNVILRDLNTTIMADSAIYHSDTGDLHLKGNIYYDDEEAMISAEEAHLNLKNKTGVLLNAEILFKKEELRVVSPEIERLRENHYLLKKAMITTCEGPIPAWCFKGRDIDLRVGDRIIAKDVTFRVKGLPLLYSPYLWAPALTERKSGLLIPSISYNRDLGFLLRQPLYIVTGEHSDTTINLDLYTERGTGEGIEYRWRGYKGNYIDVNLYHIRDSSLKKDFSEIRLKHNIELTDEEGNNYFREFMNINMVNEKEYLRIMSPFTKIKLTRFLDSTSEMSYKYPSMNLYVYGEYIQDLTYDTSRVAQRLPVTGINIYPVKVSSFSYAPYFYLESSFSNFVREEGLSTRRFYLEPGLIHSIGKTLILSQTINTKVMKYYTQDRDFTQSFIDYRTSLKTDLLKDYSSITHTIEPELNYINTEIIERNNSIDDSNFSDLTDLLKRRSIIELSILNRFESQDSPSRFLMRLTQPYNTITERYMALKGEASLELKRFSTRLNVDYDHYDKKIDTISSTQEIKFNRLTLSISERYISPEILFLSTGLNATITKSIAINSTMWYDMKGVGLRDITTDVSLKRHCWTLNLRWIQRREDYSIGMSIDLKGL